MSEMGAAVGADDLRSVAVGIGDAFDRPLDLVVKTGPPTVGTELVAGAVEGGVAPFADIDPLLEMVIVFPAERAFGPLLNNDMLLFIR